MRHSSAISNFSNRLPLASLLISNAISMIGNELAFVAIPWFVLESTGSAAKTGTVAAFGAIPLVLIGLFGGAFIDRLGFKRTSVFADLASGLTVALIPFLHQTVGLVFWQLLLLVFLGALLDAPGNTARMSLTPDLAMLAGYKLERVNAIVQAVTNLSTLLGPALAGLLIESLGPTNVLWLDAASFVISGGLIALFIPSTRRHDFSADPPPQEGYLVELKAGFQFILQHQLLRSMILFVSVANFLTLPLFSVIIPVYANQVFGSAMDLGLMLSGLGIGSLVGAVAYGVFSPRMPRRATLIGGFFCAVLPLSILTFYPGSVWFTVGALALFGFFRAPTNPLLVTVAQEITPPVMRGRVFAILRALAYLASPLGMLTAGWILEFFGLGVALVALTLAYLAVTGTLFLNPTLQDLGATKT